MSWSGYVYWLWFVVWDLDRRYVCWERERMASMGSMLCPQRGGIKEGMSTWHAHTRGHEVSNVYLSDNKVLWNQSCSEQMDRTKSSKPSGIRKS